ncbi:MAG TPA: hypothetical protein VMT82_08070 [candidate division Zixibacteria bacterium]|nr:hypothetical protein [candidate division Zixibacteria bacterium]
MLNLKEVDQAKAIMIEAYDWSVMKWLGEKKRVRKAADLANAVLDALDQKLKDGWSDELVAAYCELGSVGDKAVAPRPSSMKPPASPEVRQLAKKLWQADSEAYIMRWKAEDTFDVADRRLSTSMAREGTKQAIASWDLHEKAIALSQEVVNSAQSRKAK